MLDKWAVGIQHTHGQSRIVSILHLVHLGSRTRDQTRRVKDPVPAPEWHHHVLLGGDSSNFPHFPQNLPVEDFEIMILIEFYHAYCIVWSHFLLGVICLSDFRTFCLHIYWGVSYLEEACGYHNIVYEPIPNESISF